MEPNDAIAEYTARALQNDKISEIRDELFRRIAEQSRRETPKSFVKQKAGMDYLEEEFMRSELNRLVPMAWDWIDGGFKVITDTLPIWVVSHGTLVVFRLETGRTQSFYAQAAHRIAYKKDKPYTPDNIVDLGNDVKSANSDALKVAINRLMNIGDDVYRKEMVEFWNLQEADEQIAGIVKRTIDFKYLRKWNDIYTANYNDGKSFKETVQGIFDSGYLQKMTDQEKEIIYTYLKESL